LQLNLAQFGFPRRLPKVTVSAELRRELDESTGILRAVVNSAGIPEQPPQALTPEPVFSAAIDRNKTGTFASEMLYVDNRRIGRA
jgi:hypothetical protein